MIFIESCPDDIELLSFFESEPTFASVADHHFAYEATDSNGVHLIFSFHCLEGWIQAVLELNECKISSRLSEGVKSFQIKEEINGEYLYSEILTADTQTEVEIRLKPFISVKWNTLMR
ncbi:hypothetical protein [Pragia fontium]|uniref:Uncharacterized protein n=2 Tax=Pragia fontium TaxID=82985 RepID=A0AAJ4WAC6_9GAMM|nr:hypothetical protein [Pragia fontium]GKX61443.1 hypothetical protein SOASR032_00120 [Pragia fontium]SFC77066.1 hypothetical protein SAMN02745723_10479 [Pragia fontium DSM 5563 = ATCC 49100]VEJ55655.1 Uncharacterised protein [Pragia fontium]